MGLDTSHDAWHGAYSAFRRWRNTLARAAGYTLSERSEWGSGEFVDIDWDAITERNIMGDWEEPPADPLIYLIAHSDCDGVLYPDAARALADRLEELLPSLPPPEETAFGHLSMGWRAVTRRFIDGLRAATDAGETVEFH